MKLKARFSGIKYIEINNKRCCNYRYKMSDSDGSPIAVRPTYGKMISAYSR